jgi:SAM-dependent methyltransferase
MSSNLSLEPIRDYFANKLETFGTTPRGVDWNSETSQETRFEQLTRLLPASLCFTLVDYGSGFGSLFDFLVRKGHDLTYFGFDIVKEMVVKGRQLHSDKVNCHFASIEEELPVCDYAIASGIFNIKLEVPQADWTDYVISILQRMDKLSTKGFSFNLLTKYSDPEYMRPDLYYADPSFFFDYCKRTFAKNVALLHDYGLYDFTVLVRKQLS